jgi:hypothetical protein
MTTIMTRTIAARVAGFTFLLYIVVGISSMAGLFAARRRNWQRVHRTRRP